MPPLKAEAMYPAISEEESIERATVSQLRQSLYAQMRGLMPEANPGAPFSISFKAVYSVADQGPRELTRAWVNLNNATKKASLITDRIRLVNGDWVPVPASEFVHFIFGPGRNDVEYASPYAKISTSQEHDLLNNAEETIRLIMVHESPFQQKPIAS